MIHPTIELFSVASHVFRPRPPIHSTVIRLVPHPPAIPVSGPALFGQLVRHAYGRRRKTLRNASWGWLDEGGFGRARIAPMLRPDTPAVADFVRLANELARAVRLKRGDS